jgi:hypothetical protein
MKANPAVHPPMGGPHMDNRNVASDGSRVDQQVGVHVGDTAFHNERIYHINQGDPPERRHEVALAHLVGGTPRFAEQLLGELLWSGFATTERAYHYFLAVLSDRSFNDIHTDLRTDIVNAGKICKSLPQDEWRDVFDVVWQLLEYVRKEFAGEAEDKHFTDVLAAFGRLAPDRQDEITRQLGMIMSGVAQERLETRRKHCVVVERIASGRVERAWKFFETDPQKPRKYVPVPTSAKPSDCVRAFLGGIGVVVGQVRPDALGVIGPATKDVG